MPEQVNPEDIPEEIVTDASVSDVLLAVESLQLTLEIVLRLIRVAIIGACLMMLGYMLASLIQPQ